MTNVHKPECAINNHPDSADHGPCNCGARTNHTPGPWTAVKFTVPDAYSFWDVVKADNHSHGICSIIMNDDGEANARLIAAAPKMLAALQALYQHCSMIHRQWGENCNREQANLAIDAGLAAIQEATGD